jgi:hypothetical protein
MAPPISSFVLGLLLLCSSCVADSLTHRKLLQRSVKNCTQLHPQCRSCSVLGLNSITNSTAMVCLACSKPAYQVTEDATSCGEGGYTLMCGPELCKQAAAPPAGVLLNWHSCCAVLEQGCASALSAMQRTLILKSDMRAACLSFYMQGVLLATTL